MLADCHELGKEESVWCSSDQAGICVIKFMAKLEGCSIQEGHLSRMCLTRLAFKEAFRAPAPWHSFPLG